MATNVLSNLKAAYGSGSPKIAIVGGGLAGLNAAYYLKKAGLIATIYEAKSRVGGRIHSLTGAVSHGLVNDLGGCFINTNHSDMLALIEELGLNLFNRVEDVADSALPETAYWLDGKAYTEAEIAENLRPLAQQIEADATLLDEDFGHHAPALDQLSVKQYLDRHADKIPVPFIRTLIELGIRTEYGVEPEESSALQLLYNLPMVEGDQAELLSSDETFLVQGGSGRVIEKLANTLSGQIQTHKALTRIQSQGNGFQLTFQNASIVNADFVVLAIPFTVLRHVDLQVELPETLKRFITESSLGRNEKILAGFRNRIWRQEQGFVGESWSNLGFSQVWEDTQRQSDRPEGVLTFYLGGNEVAAVQSTPVSQTGQEFVNQLDTMLPGARAEASDRFFCTSWTEDPFVQGSYSTFKSGQYTEFSEYLYIESNDLEEHQDVHVGNLVFAGEHLSDEFYGYMNGAAQTGRLAAAVVVKQFQQGNAVD
ncbi:MAG: NAD(P)/FAD-dependent oxidoreductase [Elainellaceae cyanobacterium]